MKPGQRPHSRQLQRPPLQLALPATAPTLQAHSPRWHPAAPRLGSVFAAPGMAASCAPHVCRCVVRARACLQLLLGLLEACCHHCIPVLLARQGTYSTGGSSEQCTSCKSPNSAPSASFTSMPAATSVDACLCEAGYGGPTCEECPAGTFSPEPSNRADCQRCPGGNTSPPASTSASDCVEIRCPSGQEWSRAEGSVASCVCKPGFGGALDRAQCMWVA